MKVVILCGISGAGKSTRTQTQYSSAVVWSADNYFMDENGNYEFDPKALSKAHAWCLQGFVRSLLSGTKLIVVDNTNTSVAEVAPYAALAQAYGYELSIEILKIDVETAFNRNVHGVPRDTIVKMANKIDKLEKDLPPWWPKTVVENK